MSHPVIKAQLITSLNTLTVTMLVEVDHSCLCCLGMQVVVNKIVQFRGGPAMNREGKPVSAARIRNALADLKEIQSRV